MRHQDRERLPGITGKRPLGQCASGRNEVVQRVEMTQYAQPYGTDYRRWERSAQEQNGQVETVDGRGEPLNLTATPKRQSHGERTHGGGQPARKHGHDRQGQMAAEPEEGAHTAQERNEEEHGSWVGEDRMGEQGDPGGRSDPQTFHQNGETRSEPGGAGEQSRNSWQKFVKHGTGGAARNARQALQQGGDERAVGRGR